MEAIIKKKSQIVRGKPIKEYLREWREQHPDYENQRRRRKMAESPIDQATQVILRNTCHRAKRKKIPFTLSRAWLTGRLKSGKCDVTGIEFVFEIKSPYMPSIDRIDNDKGYTEDNCRVVIWFVNQARSNLSDVQFFDLLKKVVDAFGKMQRLTPDDDAGKNVRRSQNQRDKQ